MTWHLAACGLLTAVFAATGAYSLGRAAPRGPWITRVSHGTHVLMCLAMAAMPWAWFMKVPAALLICLFVAAGGWHLAVDARRDRLVRFAHAAMMFAMVWMVVLMSYVQAADPGHADAATAGISGTTGMDGMTGMTGMGMNDPGAAGHTMPPMDPASSMPMAMGQAGQPAWAHVLTAIFAAALLAFTCWMATIAAGRPRGGEVRARRLGVGDGVAGGLMAAGMAASLAMMW